MENVDTDRRRYLSWEDIYDVNEVVVSQVVVVQIETEIEIEIEERKSTVGMYRPHL